MSDLQCAATVLIARHGEAEYETAFLSDDGGSLSLRGREQAHQLALSLEHARVATIYCSGMARAVQTAEIIAARLGVVVKVREHLREWAMGEYVDELETIADLHRGETVLVISRAGLMMKALPQMCLNISADYCAGRAPRNCAVVEVRADGDGWLLRSWAGEGVGLER